MGWGPMDGGGFGQLPLTYHTRLAIATTTREHISYIWSTTWHPSVTRHHVAIEVSCHYPSDGTAGAKQPVQWFLAGTGSCMQRGTSVWVGSREFDWHPVIVKTVYVGCTNWDKKKCCKVDAMSFRYVMVHVIHSRSTSIVLQSQGDNMCVCVCARARVCMKERERDCITCHENYYKLHGTLIVILHYVICLV